MENTVSFAPRPSLMFTESTPLVTVSVEATRQSCSTFSGYSSTSARETPDSNVKSGSTLAPPTLVPIGCKRHLSVKECGTFGKSKVMGPFGRRRYTERKNVYIYFS